MTENEKSEGQLVQKLVEIIGSGAIGYLIGRAKYADWDKLIEKYNKRLNYLAYLKAIIPVRFLNSTGMWQVYREGVRAYLFGLPNASIPMVFKCLEIGLRSKYSEIERESGNSISAYNLIEWAEREKGRETTAHGFRILRNILHKNEIVKEQDALECIRHISEILNVFYPFLAVNFQGNCVFCNTAYSVEIKKENDYIGNIQSIGCGNCQQVNYVRILP